jgi:hypothetical protein
LTGDTVFAIVAPHTVTIKHKMRTKTLLIAAAALVAGVVSSEAQTVYSVNVVGYVNVPLIEGFNLVANPLDADGTGTNNTIISVFTNNLPVGTVIYEWTGVTYNQSSYAANKAHTATNWTANLPLNPGQGIWVAIPVGAYGGGSSNVTTTGTVLQGNLSNPNIAGPGFTILSSQVPISGALTTNLNYIPSVGDVVYTYSGGSYVQSSYAANKAHTATNWVPNEPSFTVGQGFWLNSSSGAPWTNNFIVQ